MGRWMRTRKTAALLCAILIIMTPALLFGGCSEKRSSSGVFFAMDTVMTFTLYGKNHAEALNACESEVYRFDRLLSAADPESEISRINAAAGEFAGVSEETREIITRSIELSEETGGALDITVYPLVSLWGFYNKEYRVPEPDEIAAALADIGSEEIFVKESSVKIAFGQQIELGAVAKGYLTDRIWNILREYSIKRAVISLGGNVLVLGDKPDGTPWRVGIEDPFSPEKYFGILLESDVVVVTSGDYQRYFETEDGRRYHHIFNPANGYPADNDLVSVTIISEDGTLADGLSTALFVMGSEQAVDFWRMNKRFEMILVTKTKEVILTPGLMDIFSLTESSEYNLLVITG